MAEIKNQNKTEDKQDAEIDKKIDDLLIQKRRVFLSNAVDHKTANDTIRKLWYLEETNPGKPILFIINSPGGSVDSGFAIWDQIKMISSPVYTLVTGLAASMGSVLSLAAEKGKRFASQYSRFMIHQPLISGVIQGQATDLEIQAKEIIKTRELLISLYMEKTGKDQKAIEKALDRDTWMNAEEAKNFGLIDQIVTSYKDLGLS